MNNKKWIELSKSLMFDADKTVAKDLENSYQKLEYKIKQMHLINVDNIEPMTTIDTSMVSARPDVVNKNDLINVAVNADTLNDYIILVREKMIKHKGNIQSAINHLSKMPNAVSYIYKDAQFNPGLLDQAVITIKDIFATKDAPTQGSSKILENFIPSYDATIVEKIRASGGAVVAKTHLDELALGGTGTFNAYGDIRNKLDNTRLSGGSSSGSITSFNNDISVAIASDTGDSVRLPASYAGEVGFKPSYGAVSRYGMFAFASSLDTVAWFSHNVSDSITISQVLFGQDDKDFTSREVQKPILEKLKPEKIAILNQLDILDETTQEAINKIENDLINEGIIVDRVDIPNNLLEIIEIVYSIISFSEASSNDSNLTGLLFGQKGKGNNWMDMIMQSRTKNLGWMVQKRFILGAYFLLKENQKSIFEYAQKCRRIINDTFTKIYKDYDFMMFPSATIAPRVEDGKDNNWYSSYLTAANLSGTPSLSMPFIKNKNMPINLSLDTFLYNDKALLSNGLWLEDFIKENKYDK